MKKLLFIALIGTINLTAQELKGTQYGGVFVYENNITIGKDFKKLDNAVVYTKGDVKTKGDGKFAMTKNARIYFKGRSDIQHPYIIKLEGTVKLNSLPIILQNSEEEILILDGVKKIYQGNAEFINKRQLIKRGVYDIIIKNKQTIKNYIVK